MSAKTMSRYTSGVNCSKPELKLQKDIPVSAPPPPPAPPVVSKPAGDDDCPPPRTMSHYTSGVHCLMPQECNDDDSTPTPPQPQISNRIPLRNSPPLMKMANRTSGIFGRKSNEIRDLPKRMIHRTSGVDLKKPPFKAPKAPVTNPATTTSEGSSDGSDEK